MPGFFGMPTRGGKLTILNCILWAIVAVGLFTNLKPLMFSAYLLCWPVAWLFILPALNGGSDDSLVVASVMIGLNSLLWGYGISGLLSLLEKRRDAKRSLRGFEVISPKSLASQTDAKANPWSGGEWTDRLMPNETPKRR